MTGSPEARDRVLVVQIGRERRALPLASLEGVAHSGNVFRLPSAPPGLAGAVPYRGQIVPVLDTHAILGNAAEELGPLVFFRHSGALLAMRVGDIVGVNAAAASQAAVLDIDALALPAAAAKHIIPDPTIRHSERGRPPPPLGLEIEVGGRAFWLGMDQVVDVSEYAEAVAVPWADPLFPELLMRNGAPVPVLLLHELLACPSAACGPFVTCRLGLERVAFRVDRRPKLAVRGAAPLLDLRAALPSLPAAGSAAPAASVQAVAPLSFIAVVLERQLCLIALDRVRSVSSHARPVSLPKAGSAISGARAIRGRILPVLDPRPLLRLTQGEPSRVDLEIVGNRALSYILSAQQVDASVRLEAGAIRPAPGPAVQGLAEIGGARAWLLDPAALLRLAGASA